MEIEVRTLSQIHGEESLSVVGDLMEPLFDIASDKAVEAIFKSDKSSNLTKMSKLVKLITSKHASAAYELLSILSIDATTGKRVSKKDYIKNCTPGLIFNQLIMIFSDDSMLSLFRSQSQTTELTSTGSAMENTEA